MRAVIVTGVWGAGKSTVMRRLRERMVAAGCETLVTFPQAAMLRVHTGGPTIEDIDATALVQWCDLLTDFATVTDDRYQRSRMSRHRLSWAIEPRVLLESFVFDLAVYNLPIDRTSTLELEQRLADRGATVVNLCVPHAQIQERCLVSTRAHRGDAWSRFLEGFGRDDHERARAVGRAQGRLAAWLNTSPLPVETVESPDAGFVAATGQLLAERPSPGRATTGAIAGGTGG